MKQFFFRFFTVLTLAIACTLLIQHRNWLWLCVAAPSFIFSLWWFYHLYTHNTRKIAFLLDAIENDDPAVRFYEHASSKDSSMVNVMLNRIARILYNVKQETAQREKYYELIMDFVETGIGVLNSKGSVYQKNKEAMNLLGLDVLTHVKQLSRISDELMNAIQAINNAPDGRIILKAYCDPQESIRIEIANNGPTIPPDAAEQIFVPFFTTKEEGSGIGLRLSKQIMRLSGGTLNLLPYKEKGQDTIFVLVFN